MKEYELIYRRPASAWLESLPLGNGRIGAMVFGDPLHERNIFQENALTSDWNSVVSNTELNYIFGNPPYYGGKKRTKEQRKEMQAVFEDCPSAGLLDYVAAWYMCAAKYINGTPIKVGFVSTSSITQGEQVAVLWKPMFEKYGVQLLFGYRPFKWTNEARDVAMVRCVIIGFHCGINEMNKCIYCADGTVEYTPILNPYLDGIPEITLIGRRGTTISNILEISTGNKPIDDGNYLFSEKEKDSFVKLEPSSKDYFFPWYGSDEFLKKAPRYCLLVKDCPPELLATMPLVQERIEKVRQFRKNSSDKGTRKLANTPKKFHITNIPTVRYLLKIAISFAYPTYYFDVERNIALVYSPYWQQAKKMAAEIVPVPIGKNGKRIKIKTFTQWPDFFFTICEYHACVKKRVKQAQKA